MVTSFRPKLVEITNIKSKDVGSKQMHLLETLSGRRLKVSPLFLEIILQMDGQSSVEEIAQRASQRLKMNVNAQQVNEIIKRLLEPQHLLESNPEAPVQSKHVCVTFQGIDMAYAEAIAQICEVAIKGYKDIYGIDLMKRHPNCPISVFVSRTTRSTGLYTDGKHSIYWHIDSDRALLPPSAGGYRNVYGFCHELGHLAFVPIDNKDFEEGWARYAAAHRILPYLWNRLGERAWPQPYNYLAYSFCTELPSEAPGTPSAAAELFLALDKAHGPRLLGSIIEGLQNTTEQVSVEDFKKSWRYLTGDADLLEFFSIKGF